MSFSIRHLALALCVGSTLWLTNCSKSEDPTPPQQPPVQVQNGSATGTFAPANSLLSVTATGVGGGASFTATLNAAGTYSFDTLPVGNYTLSFVAAPGYAAPVAQTVSVSSSGTTVTPVNVLTTREMLLMTPRWEMTRNISENTTLGTSADVLTNNPACSRDGFTRFNSNNVYVIDEGPTKCAATDPQTESGTWAFELNETKFRMRNAMGGSSYFNILQLTATTFQIEARFVYQGQNYVVTTTYTAR